MLAVAGAAALQGGGGCWRPLPPSPALGPPNYRKAEGVPWAGLLPQQLEVQLTL